MLPTRKLLFECPRSTGARARVRGETRRASRVLPLFGRPKIAAHSSVLLPRVYDAQRKCGAKVLFLYLFFCSFYHFSRLGSLRLWSQSFIRFFVVDSQGFLHLRWRFSSSFSPHFSCIFYLYFPTFCCAASIQDDPTDRKAVSHNK